MEPNKNRRDPLPKLGKCDFPGLRVRGFTLLEVLITLGILTSMVLFVSQLVRGGFDMRSALARKSAATHRLNVVMRKMTDDLSHAFVISIRDYERTGRRKKNRGSIFVVSPKGESDELRITVRNHQAILSNSKESDQSFVVYRVEESKDSPGRTDLYRGETSRIPSSFREDPPK